MPPFSGKRNGSNLAMNHRTWGPTEHLNRPGVWLGQNGSRLYSRTSPYRSVMPHGKLKGKNHRFGQWAERSSTGRKSRTTRPLEYFLDEAATAPLLGNAKKIAAALVGKREGRLRKDYVSPTSRDKTFKELVQADATLTFPSTGRGIHRPGLS